MEFCTVQVQLLSGKVCAERRMPRCYRVSSVLEDLPTVEETPDLLAKRVLLLDGRILLAEEVLGELDAAGTGSLVLQLIWQRDRQVVRTEQRVPKPLVLNLAIWGGPNVGKTSLFHRYTHTERYDMDTCKWVHLLVNGDVDVCLFLLDNWPKPMWISRDEITRRMNGLFVFDLTDRNSFRQVQRFLASDDQREQRLRVLVGNKADLVDRRAVTWEEAQAFSAQVGAAYFETSATEGTGIEEAVHHAVLQAFDMRREQKLPALFGNLLEAQPELAREEAQPWVASPASLSGRVLRAVRKGCPLLLVLSLFILAIIVMNYEP
ncbi:RAB39A [Symbiodinium sp. CCMP2592]|nr:RAB39A [Symbiodinium sp. CCMP2592]